jgi:hypothetical protein
MRLHFRGMRESGLMERSPSFCSYYVRFIGHFVAVYEQSAPMFARDSLRWSESAENIAAYEANGYKMLDLDVSWSEAVRQIPSSESHDNEWPYHRSE